MIVTITITLKDGVLDPEGRAIEASLKNLGYHEAQGIRTGRLLTIDMDETNAARAMQRAAKMCETLLVNTVIETYTVSVEGNREDAS